MKEKKPPSIIEQFEKLNGKSVLAKFSTVDGELRIDLAEIDLTPCEIESAGAYRVGEALPPLTIPQLLINMMKPLMKLIKQ